MIYLDHGATSFPKPTEVIRALSWAAQRATSPGRGGYPSAMLGSEIVYECRDAAASLFSCQSEQVVFTSSCTHGLNIAIRNLVKLGGRVVISGFEHNAVTRTLQSVGAEVIVAGRRLFDQDNTLCAFEDALRQKPDAAVFTHVSNVFGYVLPIMEMAQLCGRYGVPFVLDAAQSAGRLPVSFEKLGADYIAMPGHKGLLGVQGTGILLCREMPQPLLTGGTGSNSIAQSMPDYLPDRLEAGTLNVPGINSLLAGIRYVTRIGIHRIAHREERACRYCSEGLKNRGLKVFSGDCQSGTLSFVPQIDCEEFADCLSHRGIAVRAGLHCAPLAHESAGTLNTGTVRVSFGYNASREQSERLLLCVDDILRK